MLNQWERRGPGYNSGYTPDEGRAQGIRPSSRVYNHVHSSGKGDTMSTRADALRAQALKVLEEADKLDSLPKEPEGLEDGTNIVFFRVRFQEGVPPNDAWRQPYASQDMLPTLYDYVAVKTRGVWHASGRKSLNWIDWEDLIEWITSKPYWEIWTVNEVGLLGRKGE